MTNRKFITMLLTEEDPFDDGYASYEAMLHYNIACPYFSGDPRAFCHKDDSKISRDTCVQCKENWLDQEVDE